MDCCSTVSAVLGKALCEACHGLLTINVDSVHLSTQTSAYAQSTNRHTAFMAIPPPPPALPSPGQPTPGVVKQDKSSGGSVDTTKTRSGPQRVSGERPIGAAKGKQSDTEALCPPPHSHDPVADQWLGRGVLRFLCRSVFLCFLLLS